MSESPAYSVARIEFDTLREDVRKVEKSQTRLETRFDVMAVQIHEQKTTLSEIKTLLRDQEALRAANDKAMRRVIWAANMIGPKSLALAALLVSVLWEWLRR